MIVAEDSFAALVADASTQPVDRPARRDALEQRPPVLNRMPLPHIFEGRDERFLETLVGVTRAAEHAPRRPPNGRSVVAQDAFPIDHPLDAPVRRVTPPDTGDVAAATSFLT